MRILLVGYADSIHTARWIHQFEGLGWDIHLFPVGDAPSLRAGGAIPFPHPELRDVTLHVNDIAYRRPHHLSPTVTLAGAWPLPARIAGARTLKRALPRLRRERVDELARTIDRLSPDVVHSMEMQQAGYMTLEAKTRLERFPPWILSVWGNDIYLYGRLAAHRDRIAAVLAECDYCSCECRRDVELARAFGFSGTILPLMLAAGGLDLAMLARLREPGPSSRRRVIAVKGYQHDRGRALVALEAIRRCADLLSEYRIVIYSATPDVAVAAELMSNVVPIEIASRFPHTAPHEDLLRLHGRARVSIGLAISDGVSHSMVEAMAMGSYPIQSDNGCECEWIDDGTTGSLVAPEDPAAVADALRRALVDDALVDAAADANARVVAARCDGDVVRAEAIALYERAAADARTPISRRGG